MPTDLPTDFPRPSVANYQGNSINIRLGEDESARLKAMASKEGVTMFMLFMALYKVWLSKLCDQDDLLVGTPVAGRTHADLEKMIGMFVNTIVIRNRLDPNHSFQALLGSIKHKVIDCFDNQAYPYEALIEELNLPRDTGRNALFDVFFAYQNFEGSTLEMPGSDMEMLSTGQSIAKFDFSLTVFEQGDIFNLEINYASQLFGRETIQNWGTYFRRILSMVIDDVTIRLGAIDLIDQQTQVQQLIDLHQYQVENDRNATLISWFHQAARVHTDRVALSHQGLQMTYGELNAEANRLAHYLDQEGFGKGDVIAIMIERSPEMIIGMLGILKIGGIYLPIDADQPKARRQFLLEDSQAKGLLTNGEYNFQVEGVRSIEMSEVKTSSLPMDHFTQEIRTEDVAYIIYTSGSTGKPKGVSVAHRGVVNLIRSQTQTFGIDPSEVILQFSNVVFDASVEQIWLALLNGATLVIANKETLLHVDKLETLIVEEKVTHFHATPSFLETFHPQRTHALKRIIAGGEMCPISLAERFVEQCRFYNEYGPTETTVTSTVAEIKRESLDRKTLPIGAPINNTYIYILNKNGQLQPHGLKGEMYIGGEGVALGYINHDELTDKSFIDNPFRPGEIMYRTGDVGRWLPDGEGLECLGRVDDQVKVRGYRIEPGEIKHHLSAHPQISDVWVQVWQERGDSYLIGYYVSDQELEPFLLKEHLLLKLPEFMIPDYFMHLPQIPLTINGKVDKKALPVPDFALSTDDQLPETETEKAIAEIWAEVLKLDGSSLGVNTSFFSMGGQSLKAMVVANKMAKRFGAELPLQMFFRIPTIKEMAMYMDATSPVEETVGADDNQQEFTF